MEDVLDAGGLETQEATEVNPAEVTAEATEGIEPEVAEAPAEAPVEASYLAVDDYANHLVTVKVDGEEVEVPLGEALNGYMRQAAFTRKTQSVSEQAKQYADAIKVYEALRANPQAFLTDLSAALGSPAGTQDTFDEDEFLDPTEKELRELKTQLDSLKRVEEQRVFNESVSELASKYSLETDQIAEVVDHFANRGFPTLEAAYRDLNYDQELERLRELEAKAARDAAALEKKRKAAAVSSGGSKATGTVGTDPTQVKGIRAQFELAKKQLGLS